MEGQPICPLCSRPLAEPCNKHHLLPISKGGKGTATILMHKVCHDKIHAVFSEMELKREYNTIKTLQSNEEIRRFIDWIKKKEPEYYDKSVKRKRK